LELWEVLSELADKEILDAYSPPGMRAAFMRGILANLGSAIQGELEAIRREVTYETSRYLEEVILRAVTEGVKMGVKEGIREGIKEALAELLKEIKKMQNSQQQQPAAESEKSRKKK
jgi:hypothetical protein